MWMHLFRTVGSVKCQDSDCISRHQYFSYALEQIPHMLWSISRHQYFYLLHSHILGLEWVKKFHALSLFRKCRQPWNFCGYYSNQRRPRATEVSQILKMTMLSDMTCIPFKTQKYILKIGLLRLRKMEFEISYAEREQCLLKWMTRVIEAPELKLQWSSFQYERQKVWSHSHPVFLYIHICLYISIIVNLDQLYPSCK